MLTNVFRKIVALPVWAKAMLLLAPTLVLVLVGLALILSLASPPVLSWAWLIGIGGVIALIMLWRIPAWQVRNLTVDNNEDEHKKFELKNEARKTIAQIFGGFFLLMGFFFTAKQLYVAQEAQTVAREAQLNSQAAQITERFDRATKQLTSDSMEIRVGGMYAFKRIANDSEKTWAQLSRFSKRSSGRMPQGIRPKRSTRESRSTETPMDL